LPMYEHVQAFLNEDIYPFHMPGHKRNPLFLPPDLLSLDITEIPNMDVLSRPTGILKDFQHALGAFFCASCKDGESFFLVNGATAGIVASVCAVCGEGDVLFTARNAHKSVYNGAVLSGAVPMYFLPQMREDGLAGAVPPVVFDAMPQGAAAYIVSPTYEGFTSDIAEIARKVHEKDGILIVDEAHGAHFPFNGAFPPSAIAQGADIAVNSLHKTLPAPGQCAVLHVQGNRVNREKLRFYLNAMQTSSPSYMMMAAADYTLQMLWADPRHFENYVAKLRTLRENLAACASTLTLLETDDIGKLLFRIDERASADTIAAVFAGTYKIQVEMAQGRHILAMTGVADTDEGFARLLSAVRGVSCGKKTPPQGRSLSSSMGALPNVACTPREAVQGASEVVPLSRAAGRICAELIAPCPPGIALVAPGERIPAGLVLPCKNIRVLC